jgi:hypothetical protein
MLLEEERNNMFKGSGRVVPVPSRARVPMLVCVAGLLLAAAGCGIGNTTRPTTSGRSRMPNAVGAALTSAAQDPSFLALVPEFETVFESETLSIVTKAPFRPLTRLRTTC